MDRTCVQSDGGLAAGLSGGGLSGDGQGMLPPKGRFSEILSVPLHEGAAAGFCLAVPLSFTRGGAGVGVGPPPCILWLRQAAVVSETGDCHGAGFAAFGLAPLRTTFVTLRRPLDLLQAAADAARCAALDCVIVEMLGDPPCLDLSASRRLTLATEASGSTLLLLRHGGRERPSSGWTRWRVRGARSAPGAAYALGPPRLDVSRLRHRSGHTPGRWIMEWNASQGRLDVVSDRFSCDASPSRVPSQQPSHEPACNGPSCNDPVPLLSRGVVPAPLSRSLAA
jgi:protein ImuA